MEPKSEYRDFGGRPPFYETPEDIQEAINSYFQEGVTIRKVIVGSGANKQLVELPVPTITGLCYYLGFESRQSFYTQEKRDGFFYTINRARLFIEKEYEEQLNAGNTVGAIFALKNMGWLDTVQSKVDVTSNGKELAAPTFNFMPLDTD